MLPMPWLLNFMPSKCDCQLLASKFLLIGISNFAETAASSMNTFIPYWVHDVCEMQSIRCLSVKEYLNWKWNT